MALLRTISRVQQAAIAACWLLSANSAHAIDYEPISLECLLASSQAIVVVTLPVNATTNEYPATVTRVLRGKLSLSKLQFHEPAPWRESLPQFSSREGLLFLKPDGQKRWQVIGPSGEGRLALTATSVQTIGLQLPVSVTTGQYPREEFVAAIEATAQCFDFKLQDKRMMPKRHCSLERLQAAAKQSPLHEQLLKRMNDAQSQGLACVL